MKRYKNLSGRAGITSYEAGDDFIKIEFKTGAKYVYNYDVTGKENVEKMKLLAQSGKGLTSFVSKYVKDKYAFVVE